MPIPDSIRNLITKKDPNVNHIDLSNCKLTDEDIDVLEGLLESHPYITSLDVSCNAIKTAGAKGLATISVLKKLDIRDNYISDEGFEYLVKCPNLTWLDVSRNGVFQPTASKWYKEKSAKFEHLGTGFNLNTQGEVVPLSEFELELDRTTQAYNYSLIESASSSAAKPQPSLSTVSQTKVFDQDSLTHAIGINTLTNMIKNIKKLLL